MEKLGIEAFDTMFALMEQSFPEDEHRDYEQQRELFAKPAYQVYAKRSAENAALQAFLALWELGDFAYIEHFAVDPEARNGGLGSRMLQEMMARSRQRIVLEVEPPETELARRRIAFYERNGFTYNDRFYMQPPMTADRNAIPLRLMTTGGALDESEFAEVRGCLYRQVYHVPETWDISD